MVFKPSNYLEYCNGECFSPPDEIIHSGFQIRWLCMSSSECMLCRANAVLLVKWNGHWGPASPLILRAFWPCCLGMNSELLLDVSQLGLESMQAQLWASALGADSCKQACGRSLLLLVTRCSRPLPLSQLPLTAYVFLLAGSFCLVPWATSWLITGLNSEQFAGLELRCSTGLPLDGLCPVVGCLLGLFLFRWTGFWALGCL